MYGFYQPYGGNEQLVRVTGLEEKGYLTKIAANYFNFKKEVRQ